MVIFFHKLELNITFFDYLITPIQSKIHEFIAEVNKRHLQDNQTILICKRVINLAENEEQILSHTLTDTIKNSLKRKEEKQTTLGKKDKVFLINKKKKNKRHLLCPNQSVSVFGYFINKFNNLNSQEIKVHNEDGEQMTGLGKYTPSLKYFHTLAQTKLKIENRKQKKPNKYRFYSSSEKDFCIRMSKDVPIQYVSVLCDVPMKSLKRWQLVGAKRLKGCGRKVKDPQLASRLYQWYNDYIDEFKEKPTNKLIKRKAIEFSSSSDFLASNGWLDKWKRKYGIICKNDKNSNMSN
jgi:hypothetical protein